MDIVGQKSLVRRIQSDLLREAHKLHAEKRHAGASDCEDQIRGLGCVLTSLEHLENIRSASAVLIAEARNAMSSLPLAFQNKGKKPCPKTSRCPSPRS
jgi:hypothetical protein